MQLCKSNFTFSFIISDTLDGVKIHGKNIVGLIYSHVIEKTLFISQNREIKLNIVN